MCRNLYRPLQSRGVRADPSAKEQRLQQIREKIAARDKILARPQRFNTSRPLSRREMEIEQALFHGNKRQGFLTALYHRGTVTPTPSINVPTVCIHIPVEVLAQYVQDVPMHSLFGQSTVSAAFHVWYLTAQKRKEANVLTC